MSELSLSNEQQVRYDLVQALVRQGMNTHAIVKNAETLSKYIMTGVCCGEQPQDNQHTD